MIVTQYVMSGSTPVKSKVKGASQEMVASTTGTDGSVELILGEVTGARVPVTQGVIRYTYLHTSANLQILLPLSGHAHLAEPGSLCTTQALGACASKLLENGLGTHRWTSYLLTASGVGIQSPTWTTAVE